MREVVWLDSAVRENPNAAKKAAGAIKEAAKRLIETPSIGKPIKTLPHYRDLLVRLGAGGYVLRYRVSAETIYIVHVRYYRETDFTL